MEKLKSLLSWERGLKYKTESMIRTGKTVAPLVGAWIEIIKAQMIETATESLLSWERGLKYKTESMIRTGKTVAPLVGAWIEMHRRICSRRVQGVSLLSWERGLKSNPQRVLLSAKKSLLSWERGLKYFQ